MRLPGVQLPFQKAGFSYVLKPRATANFTLFIADIASLRPLPPGAGHKKQGAGYRPGNWEKGKSRCESGAEGTGSCSFHVVALSWCWAGVTWRGWKTMLLRGRALQCHGGDPTSPQSLALRASVIHSLRSAFPRRCTNTEPRACKFLSPLPMNLRVQTA